jgi:hypothetical protein
MEKVAKSTATSILRLYQLKFGCGNVRDQDLCLARWLSADVLGDISNREINGICHFVAEKCQLCFVRRYDERDDGCAGML